MEGPRRLAFFPFKFGGRRIGSNKYGEYKMQFAVHKSQATTQTCRQITIIGDAEIHPCGGKSLISHINQTDIAHPKEES